MQHAATPEQRSSAGRSVASKQRRQREVTVDPATPITPIVVPDTSDLTCDVTDNCTPQSNAPATTPGTHRSGVSLHFDSLYPDIIADGEDIDFYVPEQSSLDHSPAAKLSTSADVSSVLSLQDVYQHARSPLVAGEAPFFQLQATPGAIDAIPGGEAQRLDLSDDELELDDHETLPVATCVGVAHATAAPCDVRSRDASDSRNASDNSDTAWVDAFHRHVLVPLLPAEPPSWSVLVDATACSATVDAAMERLFPEDVVRAFFPTATPALLVELAVLVPRAVLVFVVLMARLVYALAIKGLHVYVACGLWPWRCVEAALRGAIARCQSVASRASFTSPASSATAATTAAAVLL